MTLCPIALAIITLVMASAKCNDLLFGLLKHGFGIIAHTDIFLHSVVLIAWNKDFAVCSISKTFSDLSSIALVGLDPFFTPGRGDGSRGEDLAFNTMVVTILFFL